MRVLVDSVAHLLPAHLRPSGMGDPEWMRGVDGPPPRSYSEIAEQHRSASRQAAALERIAGALERLAYAEEAPRRAAASARRAAEDERSAKWQRIIDLDVNLSGPHERWAELNAERSSLLAEAAP